MEDGLFFWLIIVAVAVLQGISRKKKKAGQPGQKPTSSTRLQPGSPRPQPGSSRPRPDRPAGQERVTAASRTTMAPLHTGQDDGEEEPAGVSSESMLPGDVWAEILGLARGEPRRAEPEASPPSEAVPVLVSTEEEPREEGPRDFPASHGAEVALHESKRSDFESRLAITRTPFPDLKAEGGGGVRADLFGSGSPEELRKAVILKEVLGLPLSLREE